MKVFVFLAIVLLCQFAESRRTDRQYGEKRCSWGPSYWCKSVSNSKECGLGALAHCRKFVWKADEPSESQANTPAVLDAAHAPSLKGEGGLTNSKKSDDPDSLNCLQCLYLASAFRKYVLVHTGPGVVKGLIAICNTTLGQLPMLEGQCKAIAHLNLTVLAKTKPERLCQGLGSCPKDVDAAVQKAVARTDFVVTSDKRPEYREVSVSDNMECLLMTPRLHSLTSFVNRPFKCVLCTYQRWWGFDEGHRGRSNLSNITTRGRRT